MGQIFFYYNCLVCVNCNPNLQHPPQTKHTQNGYHRIRRGYAIESDCQTEAEIFMDVSIDSDVFHNATVHVNSLYNPFYNNNTGNG